MSYKDKIIKLAKQYEGEDKLGVLSEINMDFNNNIDIKHDRYSRDGNEPKPPITTDSEGWSVSLRYRADEKSYESTRISTGDALTLKKCYLILQEFLKIELAKKEVVRNVEGGYIEEDKVVDEPRDIFKELATALSTEDYELASKLRDEINNDFK